MEYSFRGEKTIGWCQDHSTPNSLIRVSSGMNKEMLAEISENSVSLIRESRKMQELSRFDYVSSILWSAFLIKRFQISWQGITTISLSISMTMWNGKIFREIVLQSSKTISLLIRIITNTKSYGSVGSNGPTVLLKIVHQTVLLLNLCCRAGPLFVRIWRSLGPTCRWLLFPGLEMMEDYLSEVTSQI